MHVRCARRNLCVVCECDTRTQSHKHSRYLGQTCMGETRGRMGRREGGSERERESVWCGVVWCGVVRCGVVRCGVAWCGVVWGVVWCGVVWCGVGCGFSLARCPSTLSSACPSCCCLGPMYLFVGWRVVLVCDVVLRLVWCGVV
jgi:hypothetical protein